MVMAVSPLERFIPQIRNQRNKRNNRINSIFSPILRVPSTASKSLRQEGEARGLLEIPRAHGFRRNWRKARAEDFPEIGENSARQKSMILLTIKLYLGFFRIRKEPLGPRHCARAVPLAFRGTIVPRHVGA
jgi:hypothetical protein